MKTHEQDLGPGVVRTPGYEVEEPVHSGGWADRVIDRHGKVNADARTLSTYSGAHSPGVVSEQSADVAAEEKMPSRVGGTSDEDDSPSRRAARRS